SNDEYKKFIEANPDREVVVSVKTAAEIKALADWTVPSSNALEICSHLHKQGKNLLWGPDRFLGAWIAKQTGADMLL
ncbi:quinolinate synthase NadA, partial [Francisella tularensis]|uniref:quinolinate synthase NadA n=1 Tax=Francisella tularensis TaxID=263 RepID=UPI002381B6B5